MLRRPATATCIALALLASLLPMATTSSILRAAPPPNEVAPPPPLIPSDRTSSSAKPAPQNTLPSELQTSEFMYGKIQVELLLVESEGDEENWERADRERVISEVERGLQWWVSASIAESRAGAKLEFDTHTTVVTTTYEPIMLPSALSDGGAATSLWLGEVVRGLGYSSDEGIIPPMRRFADKRRHDTGADWAFSIVVVNSKNDPDGTFSDGFFAYSYINGPYIVMTFDNGGWGVDRMEHITAHETAHIFGALDEYTGYCANTALGGYLSVQNTNCAASNSSSQDSIMGDGGMIVRAYDTYAVSTPVQHMLGWRDSDGDGWYDVVDTITNRLIPQAEQQTWQSRIAYDAGNLALDTPWRLNGQDAWMTDGIERTPISINYVERVEYRVDNTLWQAARPLSAPWGDAREEYDFGVVLDGRGASHSIETRALNRWGGAVFARDEVVLLNDTIAPSSSLSLNLAEQSGLNIPVSWSGSDSGGSGLASYTIQVRADAEPWRDWLVGTLELSATYQADGDGRYCFRSQARDSLGNLQPLDDQGVCVTVRQLRPNLRPALPSFAPDALSADQPVRLVVNVLNSGEQAADTSALLLRLLDVEGALAAPEQRLTVATLDKGASSVLRIELGKLAAGRYTLQIHLDPDDAVTESDEGDNLAEQTFDVAADPVPVPEQLYLPLIGL